MRTKRVTAQELREGGDDVFSRFFAENRARLLAVAYRLTSSRADADDVVQEAFVSILVHHGGFHGDARPTTWAHRVTVNAALMRLRSARRRRATSLEELPDSEEPDDQRVPDPSRFEARAAVRAALDRLSDVDRRVVELRLLDGLSTDEVSATTGLSPAAVKTRLHRAKQRMFDDDELAAVL